MANSGHQTATVNSGLPCELSTLLTAVDGEERDGAWATFTNRYSRLLLHTVRGCSSHHDDAMDRYAFVLEKLRDDDCRRLRRYVADGRSEFTTWLVVVSRRLCEDFRRGKYGRVQPSKAQNSDLQKHQQAVRKRLADYIAEELDPLRTSSPSAVDPERELREAELYSALNEALGQLEARDRLLFKLRFEHDLSAKEIARLMAFPSAFHVYRRLKSRLETLRKILLNMGVVDPTP